MSDDWDFEATSATGDDPDSIYDSITAGEEGKPKKADPSKSNIHGFGGSATIGAGATGSITATPSGVTVRPDRIEFDTTQAAMLTVSGILVGGFPIMHGGVMPGACFTPVAVYPLRPGVNASPTSPVVITVATSNTASATYAVGIKGPTKR